MSSRKINKLKKENVKKDGDYFEYTFETDEIPEWKKQVLSVLSVIEILMDNSVEKEILNKDEIYAEISSCTKKEIKKLKEKDLLKQFKFFEFRKFYHYLFLNKDEFFEIMDLFAKKGQLKLLIDGVIFYNDEICEDSYIVEEVINIIKKYNLIKEDNLPKTLKDFRILFKLNDSTETRKVAVGEFSLINLLYGSIQYSSKINNEFITNLINNQVIDWDSIVRINFRIEDIEKDKENPFEDYKEVFSNAIETYIDSFCNLKENRRKVVLSFMRFSTSQVTKIEKFIYECLFEVVEAKDTENKIDICNEKMQETIKLNSASLT